MFASPAYWQGLIIGASLIMAIGAQNAFVLTQGIRKNYGLVVACLCGALDTLLIFCGVAGIGSLIAENIYLHTGASAGGAIFLLWFGLQSLRLALREHRLEVGAGQELSLQGAVATTFAVSLLNPHVYIDTVVMLGAISANYADERFAFGAGAVTASWVWFVSLNVAGRILAPLFAQPLAWRILHICVCAMVWWVAFGLLKGLWLQWQP